MIRDLPEMEHLLAESKAANLRGYLLLGQDDDSCTPNALAFHEMLQSGRDSCVCETFPGVTHDFPPDYDAAIERGLQYI